MGEKKEEVTRYFEISKSLIEEIFAAAAGDNIDCTKLRFYFAKQSAYDSSLKNPKYSSIEDYNLVVVGVDDKDENIHSTFEIHDHLASEAGTPTNNDF